MLGHASNTWFSPSLPGAAARAGAVPEREAQGADEPRGQQDEGHRGAVRARAQGVARHARRQEGGEWYPPTRRTLQNNTMKNRDMQLKYCDTQSGKKVVTIDLIESLTSPSRRRGFVYHFFHFFNTVVKHVVLFRGYNYLLCFEKSSLSGSWQMWKQWNLKHFLN